MTFLSPAVLWALPFALTPVIVYYLMRYRAIRVTWGANYVLERALARLRRRVSLKQLVLLALRTLAALMLVLAFAGPGCRAASERMGGGEVLHVLIFDGSYSMLARDSGTPFLDRCRRAVARIAAQWGSEVNWALCVAGEEPEWIVEGAAASPEAVAAALDNFAVKEEASNLALALSSVAERYPEQRVRVILLADRQAAAWGRYDILAEEQAPSDGIFWLRPGQAETENAAVLDVTCGSDIALRGHPAHVLATVKHFGRHAARDLHVECLVDGAFHSRLPLSLLPGQEKRVAFDVTFETPGSHAVTVRLPPDALEYDDAMSAALDVREALSVLVLREPGRDGKFESPWPFLSVLARVQDLDDRDGRPVFTAGALRLEVMAPDEWDGQAHHDAVLLDGGCALTPELAARLAAYAASGGGVLLPADETVDADAWNAMLGEHGLLPARLGPVRSELLGGENYAAVTGFDRERSALRAFAAADGSLDGARFYAWRPLDPLAPEARVLGIFENQSPYIVECRYGEGGCLLAAAGLSGRSNNLVVREFYPSLLYRLFAQCASYAAFPRTVRVGEPVRLRLGNRQDVEAGTFRVGHAAARPATVRTVNGERVLEASTDGALTGLGSLMPAGTQGEQPVAFAVQGPRCDSDLTPLSESVEREIRDRLGIRVAADAAELESLLAEAGQALSLHHWAVAVLMALLLAEMLVQRSF